VTDALEVSLHIAATPETVFPYFTDPARYVQWMGSTAHISATPGGLYRVHLRDGVETSGEFTEIDPPKRLVFTWGWADNPDVPPGSTRVEVTLEPEQGGTRLVLRHHGLPSAEQVEHHRQGWKLYLNRLALRARGTDPGPDPNA
jgi:uncharacterized protein YndB with AHSA1/START domain